MFYKLAKKIRKKFKNIVNALNKKYVLKYIQYPG